MEVGHAGVASRCRLDSLSSSVTTGFGEIKTMKLRLLQRDPAQSIGRLLRQLTS